MGCVGTLARGIRIRTRGCRITGAIGIFTPIFSGGGFPDLMVSVELGSIPSQGAGASMACVCPITEQLRKRQDNGFRD